MQSFDSDARAIMDEWTTSPFQIQLSISNHNRIESKIKGSPDSTTKLKVSLLDKLKSHRTSSITDKSHTSSEKIISENSKEKGRGLFKSRRSEAMFEGEIIAMLTVVYAAYLVSLKDVYDPFMIPLNTISFQLGNSWNDQILKFEYLSAAEIEDFTNKGAYVEKDGIAHTTDIKYRNVTSWGLQRISQRDLPLSPELNILEGEGEGVDIYVIDTGIEVHHKEFEGRADWKSYIYGKTDDNGHGTHVSGLIGGSSTGVAKKANVFAVKVLGADGSGLFSDIIEGIEFVIKNRDLSRYSLIHMSLGGPHRRLTNDAVYYAAKANIPVIVAAGNSNNDACSFSPSSARDAISVAASDKQDNRAYFSNWSKNCVLLYAPGTNIYSSYKNGSYFTMSGTSMAAPLVTGIAATILSTYKPQNVDLTSFLKEKLVEFATKDRLDLDKPGSNYLAFTTR